MPYFDKYIALSTSQDIEQTLVESHNHLIQTILPLTEDQMMYKYEEKKWSIKDLLQHMIDTERVFAYRAMRFARNDKTELPSLAVLSSLGMLNCTLPFPGCTAFCSCSLT